MQTNIITREGLSFRSTRTYLLAAMFVLGNVVLPQLCQLMPHGGVTWLPIYFFTLIGAYACGIHVGLITALLSPAVNALFFGMPAVAVLPAILIKSVLLAVAAAYAASRPGRVSLYRLAAVVLVYQTLGTLGEWAISGSLAVACQDIRIGIPGILMQIFGGMAVLRCILHR